MLYFDLTGDNSVTSNTISRDVEEKLRLMLSLADPSIIFDLRTNNGFNGTKFNVFWDKLEAYFNEQVQRLCLFKCALFITIIIYKIT